MIPAAFEYKKASSVSEVLDLITGNDGKILAGGHSLLPAMKLRLNRPSTLIDIRELAELKGIHEEDGEIVIGAATTHGEIAHDALIIEKLSFFSQGALTIGDVQVRNHGTIGGSLAHADPAADWPAMLLVAEAAIEVQGIIGKRRIPAKDFFTGLFSTALQEHELIIAVRIPIPPEGSKGYYEKFEQPASGFAIVGCAVMRVGDGKINIAFNGVSENAFRDRNAENELNGKSLDADSIAAAATVAATDVFVLGDQFASEEYRKHLAGVCLSRALNSLN